MIAREALAGKRILLVEDDYFTVTELSSRLAEMEVVVVGMSPTVAQALEMIASTPDLDGAILDINLGGEMVFPVADELERQGLPFVFATAYAPEIVPARHADKIVLRKPLDDEGLALGLSRSSKPRPVSIEEASGNQILALLPEHILSELLPVLRHVQVPRGAVLEVAGQSISRVYFPLDCIASLVAVGSAGSRIETGLIGREGMTGTGIALGDERTPHELINQIEGATLAMAAHDFRLMLRKYQALDVLAGRFARSLGIQVSHTALANGKFDIRTRLARWLLMVDDRAGTSAFGLTHEYLSIMLGARRSSVTEAIHILEGEHLIRSSRSNLEIRDRPRLIEFAGEAYGTPEAEHRRLMSLPVVSTNARSRALAQAIG
ncbi:Crp/Fnr family transcriptional regulator [Rhizobium sp. Root708]|uniref:helix-turn-helix domain-containing protein n=1 Tax=Rhizobium sp. Root708 TaxID=1736592 RepID=UPI0006FD5A9C|nr:helix-turn-helix domain-containing protein [Rhizobium sp. Root708]KRB49268.1 Crp/Fnr family transcriptional regulator [Rhizobium sp. Root708]